MHDTTFHRRASRAAGLLLCAALLVLAACSGSGESSSTDDDSSSEDASGGEQEAAAPTDASETDETDETAAAVADAADVDLDAAAADRDLVSTASVTVEVEDLDAASDRAVELVVDAGGYLSGEQTNRGDGARSELTLEVPRAEFQRTLAALGDLGEVQVQEVGTDDVTEAVIDLESRIATAEASLTRARELTGEATTVEDLATYESEVISRETALEELRGEQRTLEDQVALSTITVTFTTVGGAPAVQEEAPQEDEERDLPTYLGGLESGFDIVIVIGSAVLVVLGFLTPFLPAAALVAVVAWVALRRQRRHEAEARQAIVERQREREEQEDQRLVGVGATTAPDEPAPSS